MVNVATKEEFEALQSRIRDLLGDGGKRLDDIEKSLEQHEKKLVQHEKRLADIDEDRVAIHKRIDDVEEKSKSVVTRIKEAFEAVPAQKDAENP